MPTNETQKTETLNKALTISKIYYRTHINAPEAKTYIMQRGLSPQACRKFEIGYSPSNWRGLVEHYKSHTIRLAAKEAGLLSTPAHSQRLIDFFRDRLMFPIRSASGDLVGYGGRALVDKEGSPKYLNSPESDTFKKSELLYGLHEHLPAIEARREAIIVEGYLDVIRLSMSGFDYAVAPMGTSLTHEQTLLIQEHGASKLWICLDGDKAGIKAAERSVDLLMEHYHPALEIMLIKLPSGHDPDSLIREQGADAFASCMDNATTLPIFIHDTCTKGFPVNPCLEDKALYLQRLTPFLQRSAGFLQDQLLKQAQAFTGLSASQICNDPKRDENTSVTGWNELVCLAARWLIHDREQLRIARHLGRLDVKNEGLSELCSLANQINAGEKPNGLMASFGNAHGEISSAELAHLKENWGNWVKDIRLMGSLETLTKMPFDTDSKNAIRQIASSMRPR